MTNTIGGYLPAIPNDTYANNTYRMLELIVNRIESKDYSYQNGNQLQSPKFISPVDTSGTGVQAGLFLNGNVAEIIAYKSAHIDKATRETIEGYLAWKWGLQGSLPADHTYKSFAPT